MSEPIRCKWCVNSEIEKEYHDREWGTPLHDDKDLFEFLCLEGAQAGLSWLSILKRRGGYREAFDDFDVNKIAAYDNIKVEELKLNSAIIRNKLKINAFISNAKTFIEIQKEYGSFDKYIWQFTKNKSIQSNFAYSDEIPSSTPLSEKISKELKKKGFKFVGPTIIYAFMQAIGMINDHTTDCFRHGQLQDERNNF